MSSIMTNASAMTALQTLKNTNKGLEVTQNRISTGYKVAQASDNAAYWSIATTMRSDNKALATVQDSLGLGAATVDVAYTAMDSAKDYLDDIKAKLMAATAPGVDKAKIQGEINELQNQLESLAESASFSGTNWLSVDSSSSDYSATQSIVSSFTRGADNTITLGKIDVSLASFTLFDSSATGAGLLEQGTALAEVGGIDTLTPTAAVDGVSGEVQTAGAFTAFTLDADDAIRFTISVNGGAATEVTVDKATVDAALASTDGVIADSADYATVLTQAFTNAGVTGLTVADNGGVVEFTSTDTAAATSDITITGVASSDNGVFVSATEIDITNATDAELESYINSVNAMLETVTGAASSLGAIKNRIDMQNDFVSNLMDAIDRGVSQLVDADMEEESTRLQALQVQQQLGIQALSIANSNSQSILSLFRG